MDWLSPVSGLVGALFGAAATWGGTHQAQNKALENDRQARREAREDQAVATLARAFSDLHQHVRSIPDEYKPRMSSEENAALTAVRQAWDAKLQDHIGPTRLAIGIVRDSNVRHRLTEAMDLLEHWQGGGLEYAFHNRSRVWVLRGVVSHAVDCLAAWQREAGLPEPSPAYTVAEESLTQRRFEWEQEDEAHAEDQRQRLAQRASRTTEPPR